MTKGACDTLGMGATFPADRALNLEEENDVSEWVGLHLMRLSEWARAREGHSESMAKLRREVRESDDEAAEWLIDLGPVVKQDQDVRLSLGRHKHGKILPPKLRAKVVVQWHEAGLTQQV